MVHNPHTFGHVVQPVYTNKYLKYNGVQDFGPMRFHNGQGYHILSCLSLKLWLVRTKTLVYMKEITFIWLGQCKSLQHTSMPYFVPCSTGSKEWIFLFHWLVTMSFINLQGHYYADLFLRVHLCFASRIHSSLCAYACVCYILSKCDVVD